MNCKKTRDFLLLQDSGELAADLEQTLEAHLAGCRECAGFKAFLARAHDAVALSLHDREPAERVMDAVAARIDETCVEKVLPFAGWGRVLGLAASLMVVVGLAVYMTGMKPSNSDIHEISALASVVGEEQPGATGAVESGSRDEMLKALGRQLLAAEGLADEGFGEEAIILGDSDSTDPQSNSTSASRPEGRA